jgi:hypothetical protein
MIMLKKMHTLEDSQQMVVEAIQNDIPTDVVQDALGVTGAALDKIALGEMRITGEQFAAVVRLMREYEIEGW